MIGSALFLPPNPSTSTLNFTSDDDDHHPAVAAGSPSASAKKPSPWHRMKWTDDVVRLLITLVSIVGDDVIPSGGDTSAGSGKALQQKKGKWKTVSRLMQDKGCYVSPQQCEDKFNDLNKRYKRLNEILGRGTTCQVVENPSLLDAMHHVPAKSKDDVRKILSSKHLFYREMCAYHNGQRIPNSHDLELNSNGIVLSIEEHEHDHDHHDVHELKDSEEEEEEDDDDEEEDGKVGIGSSGIEIDGLSPVQQREWLRKRALQLLEEKVEIEAEEFECAKRRAKWERFKSKKDWEMERERLENKRSVIENERTMLLVRRKEMELDSGREHGRIQ